MLDSGDEGGAGRIGGAVLSGILTFLVLEKVLEISNPETNEELREGFKKKIKKMVGFIQRSSDPSQPGRALDKKNSKITQFLLCL